jgi:L-asparaginase
MTNVNAFSSPNTGPLGQVYDSKVFYNMQTLNRHGGPAAFDVSKIDSLPRVEIVYFYADASNVAINAFIDNKVAGIIIAGTGGGSFNKSILESVKNAVVGEIDDSKLGTIVSDNLNPQKARILLMLALTTTSDKNKIQEMFFEY